jgi:ankyrin repeat protein
VIEFLLSTAKDKKAIDTPNRDGRTCLHIAALTNNLWLAKFLLDHDADVNAVMRNKVR